MSILVTGATGHLGALALDALLRRGVGPDQIVAAGRNQVKLERLAARRIRRAVIDYDDVASLRVAFKGAETLLLISGSEVGQRVVQHKNVIEAASESDVQLIVYTSILRAGTATHVLATEHRATEELLVASGVPYVLLRNSWYFENYTAQIPAYLQNGRIVGAAGDGRISGATREDYAEAAAAVLTTPNHTGAVYELGGDQAFTMVDLASELSRQTRQEMTYQDLSIDEYAALLVSDGLPVPTARAYADADRAIAAGELYVETRDLSGLIGRPTTTLSRAIGAALGQPDSP